jgi:hypothetical protein
VIFIFYLLVVENWQAADELCRLRMLRELLAMSSDDRLSSPFSASTLVSGQRAESNHPRLTG